MLNLIFEGSLEKIELVGLKREEHNEVATGLRTTYQQLDVGSTLC